MPRIEITILYILCIYIGISAQGIEYCSASKQKLFRGLESTNEAQYLGDQNIDVTYYKLDLIVDYNKTSPDTVFLEGSVTIDLQVKSSADYIFLDLDTNMSVTNVTVNNTQAEFNHLDNKIYIPDAYSQGNGTRIVIDYNGKPKPTGYGSFDFNTNYDAVWTLSEPYGAKDWFPCKNTPADKADSADIWITTSNNLVPVSNGILESITQATDSTHTYKWHEKHPIANYLISLAIAPYEKYTQYYHYSLTDSMEVTHFNYPAYNTEERKKTLNETVDMLEVFSELYGEYPFVDEKYGHAEFPWGGGMEHQTITSLGTSAYSTSVISHELAHQWFGDMITCADWNNIWLNEGFATYSEALYLERKNGQPAYLEKLLNNMNSAKKAEGTIYVQDISSESEIFNSSRTYAKAAVILHMLRGVVGDSTFFSILYSYANSPELRYATAVTEDFQEVAENVAGMDLDWFFNEWIYQEGYPQYNFSWSNSFVSNDSSSVTLIVKQTSNNTDSTLFKMPIEFEITFNDSSKDSLVVWDSTDTQTFNFIFDKGPVNIELDPGNWILKDIVQNNTDSTKSEETSKEFRMVGIYPNPFNQATKIEFYAGKSALINITAYNLLGETVENISKNELYSPGYHTVVWDAKGLSSGVYLVSVSTQNFNSTRKVILLK